MVLSLLFFVFISSPVLSALSSIFSSLGLENSLVSYLLVVPVFISFDYWPPSDVIPGMCLPIPLAKKTPGVSPHGPFCCCFVGCPSLLLYPDPVPGCAICSPLSCVLLCPVF